MKFLSICSGIEAASVAWNPLGWKAVGFSEIEKFPSEVLSHRHSEVKNFGDMTGYAKWDLERPELIVGGTPCQAFSLAGRRESLADERGNLSLTFCKLVKHYDPEWVVWENVPGVLSTKDNAFGCFLAGLVGSDEPISRIKRWPNSGVVTGPERTAAWRVLDAQHFGVAQRRKRVFVLSSRGARNWKCARALFDFTKDGIGNFEKGNNKEQTATPGIKESANRVVLPINTMTCQGRPSDNGKLGFGIGKNGDVCPTITKNHSHAVAYENHPTDARIKELSDVFPTVTSRWGTGGGNVPLVQEGMTVRKLMPVECERLQGFPDGYTDVYTSKRTPDSHRYKALGNSMAVPVMRWLGQRMDQINKAPSGAFFYE